MTSTVVAQPMSSEHVREDGSPWPFALSLPQSIVLADTAGEVVGALLPNYLEIEPGAAGSEAALLARWESAVATASDVQAMLCVDRAHEGLFDPAAETEDTLTAIFADKMVPVEVSEWDHEHVPLVLITTDYAPYTERVPVTGNVLWVDPSDELSFLMSLANLGVIKLYVQAG